MKILFMGTASYSRTCLEALYDKYEIAGVVTKKDSVVGRKREIVFSEVKNFALEHNIPLFQPDKLKDDYEDLMNLDYDILVTAAFGEFVPERLLNKAKYPSINAHASLLPKYRGGSPIHTAIKNGDEYTGVTVMQMVKKMDAGDIILQEKIKIEDDDTASSMFDKLASLASKMLVKVIDNIDNITMTPQNEDEVSFAYNISHEEEQLDFEKTSKEVYNHIRGYYSFPTTYTNINGEVVKVFQSTISQNDSDAKPGTVLDLSKNGILVKTKDGAILLTDIQLRGKKRMLVRDFINGNKLIKKGDMFVYEKEGDK